MVQKFRSDPLIPTPVLSPGLNPSFAPTALITRVSLPPARNQACVTACHFPPQPRCLLPPLGARPQTRRLPLPPWFSYTWLSLLSARPATSLLAPQFSYLLNGDWVLLSESQSARHPARPFTGCGYCADSARPPQCFPSAPGKESHPPLASPRNPLTSRRRCTVLCLQTRPAPASLPSTNLCSKVPSQKRPFPNGLDQGSESGSSGQNPAHGRVLLDSNVFKILN